MSNLSSNLSSTPEPSFSVSVQCAGCNYTFGLGNDFIDGVFASVLNERPCSSSHVLFTVSNPKISSSVSLIDNFSALLSAIEPIKN